MHHINHGFDMIYWCVLQNAMPEIEDMTRSSIRAAKNFAHSDFDLGEWCEKNSWIKIPLNSNIISKQRPTIVQMDAPVQSNHICPGAFHQRKKSCGIRSEVNDWHPFRLC